MFKGWSRLVGCSRHRGRCLYVSSERKFVQGLKTSWKVASQHVCSWILTEEDLYLFRRECAVNGMDRLYCKEGDLKECRHGRNDGATDPIRIWTVVDHELSPLGLLTSA